MGRAPPPRPCVISSPYLPAGERWFELVACQGWSWMVMAYPSGSVKVKVRPNGESNGATVMGTPSAARRSCNPWAVVGVQPQRDTDPGLGAGRVQVHPGAAAPGRRRTPGRCRTPRHRAGRGGGTPQSQPGLVELGRPGDVAHLQGDEGRSGHGHDGVLVSRVSTLTQDLVCQNIDMSQGEMVGPVDQAVGQGSGKVVFQ